MGISALRNESYEVGKVRGPFWLRPRWRSMTEYGFTSQGPPSAAWALTGCGHRSAPCRNVRLIERT